MTEDPPPTVLFFYDPHEVTLSGKNRSHFEQALVDNLRRQMMAAGVTVLSIRKLIGRHLLVAHESDIPAVVAVSPRVFGIGKWANTRAVSGKWKCSK
jgi:adenylyl- and sulfurtransferase ThiI